MTLDLTITKTIKIISPASQVWRVLTDPAMITQYFTGAETKTNWQIGSEIVFVHIYEGKVFENKGIILDFKPGHLLSYTYWTAFSNTEDKPENYTSIVYTLSEALHSTNLTLQQTNFKNVDWYNALQTGWDTVLLKIKALAEE